MVDARASGASPREALWRPGSDYQPRRYLELTDDKHALYAVGRYPETQARRRQGIRKTRRIPVLHRRYPPGDGLDDAPGHGFRGRQGDGPGGIPGAATTGNAPALSRFQSPQCVVGNGTTAGGYPQSRAAEAAVVARRQARDGGKGAPAPTHAEAP